MKKFRVTNYYMTSVDHEVEAEDADKAYQIGRDIEETEEELAGNIQYDETLVTELKEDGSEEEQDA